MFSDVQFCVVMCNVVQLCVVMFSDVKLHAVITLTPGAVLRPCFNKHQ